MADSYVVDWVSESVKLCCDTHALAWATTFASGYLAWWWWVHRPFPGVPAPRWCHLFLPGRAWYARRKIHLHVALAPYRQAVYGQAQSR